MKKVPFFIFVSVLLHVCVFSCFVYSKPNAKQDVQIQLRLNKKSSSSTETFKEKNKNIEKKNVNLKENKDVKPENKETVETQESPEIEFPVYLFDELELPSDTHGKLLLKFYVHPTGEVAWIEVLQNDWDPKINELLQLRTPDIRFPLSKDGKSYQKEFELSWNPL